MANSDRTANNRSYNDRSEGRDYSSRRSRRTWEPSSSNNVNADLAVSRKRRRNQLHSGRGLDQGRPTTGGNHNDPTNGSASVSRATMVASELLKTPITLRNIHNTTTTTDRSNRPTNNSHLHQIMVEWFLTQHKIRHELDNNTTTKEPSSPSKDSAGICGGGKISSSSTRNSITRKSDTATAEEQLPTDSDTTMTDKQPTSSSSSSSQEDDFRFEQGTIVSTKYPSAVSASNCSRATQINNDNSNDKENDNSMPPPRSIKNRKRSASSSSSSSLLSQSRRQKENVVQVAQTGKSSKKKKSSTFLSVYVDNNKAREKNQGTHKEDAGREMLNSRVDDNKPQYFGSDKAIWELLGKLAGYLDKDGKNIGSPNENPYIALYEVQFDDGTTQAYGANVPLDGINDGDGGKERITVSLCAERLDTVVEGVIGIDPAVQSKCTTQLRRWLTIKNNPLIQDVIDAGDVTAGQVGQTMTQSELELLPLDQMIIHSLYRIIQSPIQNVIHTKIVSLFVFCLQQKHVPRLQLEAANVLAQITTLSSEHTKIVTEAGAVPIVVPILVHRLSAHTKLRVVGDCPGDTYPLDENEEDCLDILGALGYIASESPSCRDLVLQAAVMPPLLQQLHSDSISVLINATSLLCALSKFDCKKPSRAIRPSLPALLLLIHNQDEHLLTNVCIALFRMMRDGKDEESINAVIVGGGCGRRLVDLLLNPSVAVQCAALHTVCFICCGNNSQRQCIINNDGIPRLFGLLSSSERHIRDDVWRTISNIYESGNDEQKQAVVEFGYFPTAMNCNSKQIKLLVQEGYLFSLFDRLLIAADDDDLIQNVIAAGVVPRFVEFLQQDHAPWLQYAAVLVISAIAMGTFEQIKAVTDLGAVPIIVCLLLSPNDDVRYEALRALGNIAGDSPPCRDLVLQAAVMPPLLQQLNSNTEPKILRMGTWLLTNLFCGPPHPDFETVRSSLPILSHLIFSSDEEVLFNVCTVFAYLAVYQIKILVQQGYIRSFFELLAANVVGPKSVTYIINILQYFFEVGEKESKATGQWHVIGLEMNKLFDEFKAGFDESVTDRLGFITADDKNFVPFPKEKGNNEILDRNRGPRDAEKISEEVDSHGNTIISILENEEPSADSSDSITDTSIASKGTTTLTAVTAQENINENNDVTEVGHNRWQYVIDKMRDNRY